MKECESIANELGYPDHMIHFEDFGNGGGGDLGESFEVEVDEPNSNRHESMTVPPNKTLLDVLNDTGFDVLYSSMFSDF
ncbi:phthalate 4,5-dioxygenase oxygenase reductase [Fusarium bulbicola]|nr:phthalate 4,5-dioxygenase oxygenase reductase [Fusarium bulbicola]